MKRDEIKLICCILGGWFGLHHFIDGNFKKGILYLFTGGIFFIGWIIDIIKLLTQIKETQTNKYSNNKNKNIIEDENQTNSAFKCEVVKECHKSECHRLINTCIYWEEIDKDDLYDGYTDKEIAEFGIKVYKCNNSILPCDITYDNDKKHYIITYNNHNNDYFLGHIPDKYNEKINDIINNKTVTFGGIKFTGGLYKEYDFEKDKVIEDYDEYQITLFLSYK